MDFETGTWKVELIANIYEMRVAREILNTPHSKFGALDKNFMISFKERDIQRE